LVNGKRTTVPSFAVKEGDVIELREGSKGKIVFAELDKKLKNHKTAAWLNWDNTKMQGQVREHRKILILSLIYKPLLNSTVVKH